MSIEHPYGYIQDGKIYLKGYLDYDDRQIGEVKESNEATIAYFERRFEHAAKKIDDLQEAVVEAENKGSYLMKLIHLRKYLAEYDGLGDFTALFAKLDKIEDDLRDLIADNRVKNLEIKRALLAEAEEIKDDPDWKAVTEQLLEIKRKWVKTGSVDEEYEEETEGRFKELLDEFFGKKKAYYEDRKQLFDARLEEYEALLDRAFKLMRVEDVSEAAEQFKQLQQEWKAVGQVRAKDLRNLSKQLQQYGKQIFGKLKKQRGGGYGERGGYGNRGGGYGNRQGGYGNRGGGYGDRQGGYGNRGGGYGDRQGGGYGNRQGGYGDRQGGGYGNRQGGYGDRQGGGNYGDRQGGGSYGNRQGGYGDRQGGGSYGDRQGGGYGNRQGGYGDRQGGGSYGDRQGGGYGDRQSGGGYGNRQGGGYGDRQGGGGYGNRQGGGYGDRQGGGGYGNRQGGYGDRGGNSNYQSPQDAEQMLAEKRFLLEEVRRMQPPYDDDSIERVKQLQMEWRRTGLVRHPMAGKVTEEFRTMCEIIREKYFLEKAVRGRFNDFESVSERDKIDMKMTVVRDLLARDEQELELFLMENADQLNQERVDKIVRNKLNTQKRKVKVKKQILEELEGNLNQL